MSSQNEITIKFFPKHNAFTISPAPTYRVGDESADFFRWIFCAGQDSELLIQWEENESEKITNACLQFGRHDSSRDRPSPMLFFNEKKSDWEVPIFSYPLKSNGELIKITANSDGAKWFFNFYCTIDGVPHIVDPEGQLGSGTNNQN